MRGALPYRVRVRVRVARERLARAGSSYMPAGPLSSPSHSGQVPDPGPDARPAMKAPRAARCSTMPTT